MKFFFRYLAKIGIVVLSAIVSLIILLPDLVWHLRFTRLGDVKKMWYCYHIGEDGVKRRVSFLKWFIDPKIHPFTIDDY